jgi:hypothetical protein
MNADKIDDGENEMKKWRKRLRGEDGWEVEYKIKK